MSERYGRYEIKSELGQGGMATVYLAHDPRFGRDVALKVMSYHYREDPTFRGRFEREARTIASLEHPAIVPVYDFGEDNQRMYLVMRYMPGGSLAERIVMQQPFALADALPIVQRIASALDHAHRQGVIHRDLKPANILFDQYDNAFLSDFGIVKLVAEHTTGADYTGSGVIGTPAYMSPEQIHGEETLDGRADIYTLGVILFEMLTGIKPYRAETPVKQMMAHVLNPIPSVRTYRPELSPDCEEIIRRVLAKEREARFRTGADLTTALTQSLTSPQQLPRPLPSRAPASPPPQPAQAADGPTLTVAGSAMPVAEPAADNPVDPPTRTSTQSENEVPSRRRLFLWLAGTAVLVALIGFVLVQSGVLSPDATPTALPIVVQQPTATPTATGTLTRTPTTTATSAPTRRPTSTPTAPPGAAFTIGQSASGTPLEAVQFGTGSQRLLLIGGLHAGFAPGSVAVAETAVAYFSENPEAVPAGMAIIIVPNANPDSEASPGELLGRLNQNGVDLNRNWDCRWRSDPLWRGVPGPGLGGTAPFSEPETAALQDLILENRPLGVVVWQARATGGLVSPGSCDDAPQVSVQLAQAYGSGADYPIVDFETLVAQEVNGDITNWLDAEGIPAISVLLPEYEGADWERNLSGIQAIIALFAGES